MELHKSEPKNKKDIDDVLKIIHNMIFDFVLDTNRSYTIMGCEEYFYILESPINPREIFNYAANNPDNLPDEVMDVVKSLIRANLLEMFDNLETRKVDV